MGWVNSGLGNVRRRVLVCGARACVAPAQAPPCGTSFRSHQADASDLEREGAGLALGDHEADLADAGRVKCRCAGDISAAEGGAEGGQGNVQRLPGGFGGKAGLVIDAVECIVGQ